MGACDFLFKRTRAKAGKRPERSIFDPPAQARPSEDLVAAGLVRHTEPPDGSRVHVALVASKRVWTEKETLHYGPPPRSLWGLWGAYNTGNDTAYWDGYWPQELQAATDIWVEAAFMTMPPSEPGSPWRHLDTYDTVLHEVAGHCILKLGHHGVMNAVMGGPHHSGEAPADAEDADAWAGKKNDEWRQKRSRADYDEDRRSLRRAILRDVDWFMVRRAHGGEDLP